MLMTIPAVGSSGTPQRSMTRFRDGGVLAGRRLRHNQHVTLPTPFRFEIVKTYPRRGPLQQFRAGATTSFVCSRCTQAKSAKLIATIGGGRTDLICNACYGYLLSVWDICVGAQEDHDRDEALLRVLSSAVTAAGIERGRVLLLTRETRATTLSPEAQTALSTAEAVGAGLVNWQATDLDWSAAIVCMCKAVEIELRRLVAEPLKQATRGADLSTDAASRDLAKMARYCLGEPRAHIELGAYGFFLSKVTTGSAATGPMARALRDMSRHWPRSDWLFEVDAFPASLGALAKDYRNRAAHTEILTQADFDACAQIVSGANGILWTLIAATTPR
jgi:hypothetical protein